MQKLTGIPPRMLLTVDRLILQYKEYQQLTNEIQAEGYNESAQLLKLDRQQVSDEMTFANHLIWLVYKHRAYQGTPKALNTLQDLAMHCAPVDDICHKRWEFLKAHLPELSDHFPSSTPLEAFYQSDQVISLLANNQFLKDWKSKEFFRAEGKIMKWA